SSRCPPTTPLSTSAPASLLLASTRSSSPPTPSPSSTRPLPAPSATSTASPTTLFEAAPGENENSSNETSFKPSCRPTPTSALSPETSIVHRHNGHHAARVYAHPA